MRLLLATLAALAIAACGCETNKVLVPSVPSSTTAATLFATTYVVEDGVTKRIETWRLPNLVTYKVIYVCDYPAGYAGPPPPGHCYTDGTSCTPYTGGPPPPAAGEWRADGDGSVVKVKALDPTDTTDRDPTDTDEAVLRGDPTADD